MQDVPMRLWFGAVSATILSALIVGWFAPSDRYEILGLLIALVATALGFLFLRLTKLQSKVDEHVEARAFSADMARAFQNSEFDYAEDTWRDSSRVAASQRR